MDKNQLYLLYLDNESEYYEKTLKSSSAEAYQIKRLPADCESRVEPGSPWKYYGFLNKEIEEQGWKIHISATLGNAQLILEQTSDILFERKVSFKHIADKQSLYQINSKNGNRINSGKFITIYPPSNAEFLELLKLLYEKLKDQENGPYILSDRNWKNSNIYYRYGGFKRMLNKQGEMCIKNEQGELIPDHRTPYYRCPSFVQEFDDFLSLQNNSPSQSEKDKLNDYDIKKVLRFNNGGGIYLAERKADGKKVVIKEARPKVGLDGMEKDAVIRLESEHDALIKLADVEGIVNVVDFFKSWKHSFLVEEYAEGKDLTSWVAMNFPFHRKNEAKTYLSKITNIITQLIDLTKEMHKRDVGMGDLQPSNIMVVDKEKIVMIDFESAKPKDSEERVALHTIGFSSLRNENHAERDWYAIKRILRYCVQPIGPVSHIDEGRSGFQKEWIKKEFGSDFYRFFKNVDAICDEYLTATKEVAFADQMSERIAPEQRIERLLQGLQSGIITNPGSRKGWIRGDIRQYEQTGGMLNVLTGGMGAALALRRNGYQNEQINIWIREELLVEAEHLADEGLFTGISGIAAVLYESGYLEEAKHLYFNEAIFARIGVMEDISLRSGLSGIGLALLSFYLEEEKEETLTKIKYIAEQVAQMFEARIDLTPKDWAAVPIGLMDGWAGASLLFSALYAVSGDESFRETAKKMIAFDLEKTKWDETTNTLQTFDHRNRLLPYLSGGSIGLTAAIWYLDHVSGEEQYTKEKELIMNLNEIRCTFSGGLLDGAGSFLLIPAMKKTEDLSRSADIEQALDRLHLFLIEREDRLLFPGNFCYKLSEDLYSGSAGIILALQGIQKSNPLHWLPLINIENFIDRTRFRKKTLLQQTSR